MELNKTRKALFTFGVGAFGKIAEMIHETDYLPQKPSYMLKLLKLTNQLEKSNQAAKELSKDKDLVAKVLNIPSLEENYEKLDREDYANAIKSVEKTLVQSCLETDFARKYHLTMDEKLVQEELKERWMKNVRSAIIAKTVAKWLDYSEPEIAFFAALLKDVPTMVLAINDPETREKVDEKIAKGMGEREAELVVHGFDHTEFGAKLMKFYGMPQHIVDMMQHDYQPEKTKNQKLAKIVNFSRFLAHCFADKDQSPSSIWTESQPAIDELGLKISSEEWGNKISLLFVKSLEFHMSVTERREPRPHL